MSLLLFFRPAALAILPHGRDLAEVFWPTLGGFLAADATRIGGNQGIIDGSVAPRTFKHISKLKQALLFVKGKGGELSI
ncbi:MAG TPA: hypothetical protein VNF02_06245 [Candidatus Limnocylindrales bacterium]|nr:hypothetical protein [Candidatus Limnocylindrales bacterium]